MVKLDLEVLLKFQHCSLGLGLLLGLLELSGELGLPWTTLGS